MGGSRRLVTAMAGAAAIVLGTATAGYGVYDAWQQEQQEQQAEATNGSSGRPDDRSRASTTPDSKRGGRAERTPTPQRDTDPTRGTPSKGSDGAGDSGEDDATPKRTQETTAEPEQTTEGDAGKGDTSDDNDSSGGDDGGNDGNRDGNGSRSGPSEGATTASSQRAQFEAEVIRLTNVQREEHGCDQVQINDALKKAARGHSEDMAERDYFSHTSPDGETPWDRMREAGYHQPAAENIAKGQSDPAAVVQAWMDSEGHRENILNCSYESIGVGVHIGEGPYWTQNFGYE